MQILAEPTEGRSGSLVLHGICSWQEDGSPKEVEHKTSPKRAPVAKERHKTGKESEQ